MGDVMVLVDSEEEEEEEEDKGAVAEVVGQEMRETEEELPKEIGKHGHIHRVTALVNGNLDRMGNGLQEFQGKLPFLPHLQVCVVSLPGRCL